MTDGYFHHIEELVEEALKPADHHMYFVVVDGPERHWLKEQVDTMLGDQIDSMSRPPTIQYNLVNGNHIRFLAARVIDVMKAWSCAGVYIAPIASTVLDRRDHALIQGRVRQHRESVQ